MLLQVSGMTCAHCVEAVTRAVKRVPLVDEVTVDLDGGRVTVTGRPDPDAVQAAITEEGYAVERTIQS